MSRATGIAIFAVVAALAAGPNQASARDRLYPMTACGPDLAYLCPLHGYFDLSPFHYNLAIYPGCIKTVRVATPAGTELRRVLVCG